MGAVWYVVVGIVVLAAGVLAWASLPLLRRVRPLSARLAAVRGHRGELAVLARRVAALDADIATVREKAVTVRKRALDSPLNRAGRRRHRSDTDTDRPGG